MIKKLTHCDRPDSCHPLCGTRCSSVFAEEVFRRYVSNLDSDTLVVVPNLCNQRERWSCNSYIGIPVCYGLVIPVRTHRRGWFYGTCILSTRDHPRTPNSFWWSMGEHFYTLRVFSKLSAVINTEERKISFHFSFLFLFFFGPESQMIFCNIQMTEALF